MHKLLGPFIVLVFLAGCASAPSASAPIVEVTRVVEVTVPVEVTRIVEVTVAPVIATPTELPAQLTAAGPELGGTAQGYGYTLTATAVQDPAPAVSYYEPKPATRLVGVEIVLANEAGEVESTNLLNAVLIDADGFSYAADTGLIEDPMELIDLLPGTKLRGWVGFEVPISAKPARLRWDVRGALSRDYLEVGLFDAPAAGPPPTEAAAPAVLRADEVIAGFLAAGLEAESASPMTKDDYGAAPMVGAGVRFVIPSLCADCGGRVIIVEDDQERAQLVGFYDEMGKASALAFSWVFEKGPVVVQLNGDLPEEQARKYQAALP